MKSAQQILNEIPKASLEDLRDLMVVSKQETELDRWNKLQEIGKMGLPQAFDFLQIITKP